MMSNKLTRELLIISGVAEAIITTVFSIINYWLTVCLWSVASGNMKTLPIYIVGGIVSDVVKNYFVKRFFARFK